MSKKEKMAKVLDSLTSVVGILEKCGGRGGKPGPCPDPRSRAGHGEREQHEHAKPPKKPASGDDSFSTKKLFKTNELNQPPARQPDKTKAGVYELAKKAQPSFEVGLNTGKGVDRAIGGKTIRPSSAEEFHSAINSKGNSVIIAPLKGEKRATEKVEAKYEGDYSRLHDVVRATVAVDSKSEIPRAISALREHMGKNGYSLVEVDNRMEKPLPTGYRDINTKWKSRDGFITEIQVNTKAMIRAKEGPGHKLYEEYRVLDEGIKKAGRQPTPEEHAKLTDLAAKQSDVYGKAWAS